MNYNISYLSLYLAEISNSGMYQVPSMPGTPHLDHKSFHGSMMIRGRDGNPKMVLTENGAPSHLPMRDTKRGSTLPNNYSAKDFHRYVICLKQIGPVHAMYRIDYYPD